MPQEPLHLIQVYPGLNHPGRERMAKIVEMEIMDLRSTERDGQRSPDIAPIEGRWLSLWKTISIVPGRTQYLSFRRLSTVVFTGIVRRSPFFERKTVTVRRNRSTPAHVRARISPMRIPV